MTQGYLKKETKSIGIMFKKSWQLKYCILDLQKFEFRYAKNPTEDYTTVPMNSVIDVIVEDDPKPRNADKSVFSLTRKDQSIEGFNFNVICHARSYRMQASTKVEQQMWVRAFSVMFELRNRLLQTIRSGEQTPA